MDVKPPLPSQDLSNTICADAPGINLYADLSTTEETMLSGLDQRITTTLKCLRPKAGTRPSQSADPAPLE